MKNLLRKAFQNEIKIGSNYFDQSDYESAFSHFERAHILGQSYIIPHTVSHWWMLRVGIKRRDFKEVFGQVPRILASIIFSRIWVPLGNTGGANVHPLRPMPIPKDLKILLE